jgi:Uma2 family endonuclease
LERRPIGASSRPAAIAILSSVSEKAMTPPDATSLWTYSEYARLPDDGDRYEVIDGEVCVTPAPGPRHQDVAAKLFRALDDYVEAHDLGRMYWDVDLLFVTGQFLRPDMVFVPKAVLGAVTDRGVEAAPGLVVEVVSPHSGGIDRIKKPPRYRDFGVPEYWVVDPIQRRIEIYGLAGQGAEPKICTEIATWQPDERVPALELPVATVFRGL